MFLYIAGERYADILTNVVQNYTSSYIHSELRSLQKKILGMVTVTEWFIYSKFTLDKASDKITINEKNQLFIGFNINFSFSSIIEALQYDFNTINVIDMACREDCDESREEGMRKANEYLDAKESKK